MNFQEYFFFFSNGIRFFSLFNIHEILDLHFENHVIEFFFTLQRVSEIVHFLIGNRFDGAKTTSLSLFVSGVFYAFDVNLFAFFDEIAKFAMFFQSGNNFHLNLRKCLAGIIKKKKKLIK